MKNNLNEPDDNRKLLSIVAHIAILFSSTGIAIGVPIAIMVLSQDSVVKENAKEALNFFITCYILAIIFGVLTLIVIGFPLLILLGIASLIMPIMACLKIAQNPDRSYRYPLILHLF